jgi:hypothetical protein
MYPTLWTSIATKVEKSQNVDRPIEPRAASTESGGLDATVTDVKVDPDRDAHRAPVRPEVEGSSSRATASREDHRHGQAGSVRTFSRSGSGGAAGRPGADEVSPMRVAGAIAPDVCRILGHGNSRVPIKRLDDDAKGVLAAHTSLAESKNA